MGEHLWYRALSISCKKKVVGDTAAKAYLDEEWMLREPLWENPYGVTPCSSAGKVLVSIAAYTVKAFVKGHCLS